MMIKNRKVIGCYLIAAGVLFLFSIILKLDVYNALLGISLFLSLHLILKALINSQKSGRLFLSGSVIFVLSTFFLIYENFFAGDPDYSLIKIWPLIPLAIGICFIVYKILIDKENIGVYISGIFISFISLVLFFYLYYGLTNFKEFLLILLPCFVVYIGIYLLTDNNKNRGE